MAPDPTTMSDELSEAMDGEYGSGTELSTTTFLVLGLLTFWIYTVWHYHRLLRVHASQRLRSFRAQLDPSSLPRELRKSYDTLISKGFRFTNTPRNVAIGLYALSVALIASQLVAEGLYASGALSFERFYVWVYSAVGAAALLFCAASIYFMTSVCRAMRDHEYHELLLARLVTDAHRFRVVRPSAKFVTRWNRNQSLMALFLILSVPMTVSPVMAARQVHLAADGGYGFGMSIVGSLLVLFICAAVFHLWGSHLLLEMYNGHLRIEEINQQTLRSKNKWLPESTPSVIDDDAGRRSQRDEPGDLLPRRVLAAIMITDMVGFSKDMEHSEADTYSKLMRHNDIVRQTIARNSGTEVKTIGDAFLVRFASAVDAVQAAVDIQRALGGHNRDRVDNERIVVRIGIHTGHVLTMDGDVLGNSVNLAARIQPLADPGGICISEDTYRLVRSIVDIPVSSLGRRQLKNIANPPELFAIAHESIARSGVAAVPPTLRAHVG
ncbi:MAG: adenylate/guanylate cyclase domain-containing protein [Vicinamibacterales bacterium]